jgi:hypothetical protein
MYIGGGLPVYYFCSLFCSLYCDKASRQLPN